MNFNEHYERASVEQLIRWWDGTERPDWSTQTALFIHKTGRALGRAGRAGVEFLKTQLDSTDLNKRTIALSSLAVKSVADEYVLSHLIKTFRNPPHPKPGLDLAFKTLALHLLVAIEEYPLQRDEVEPLMEHGERELAAAAMVYLSYAFPREAVPILRKGIHSTNPSMRAEACSEAGFRNLFALRREVEQKLHDSDEHVARSAQIGCEIFEVNEPKD